MNLEKRYMTSGIGNFPNSQYQMLPSNNRKICQAKNSRNVEASLQCIKMSPFKKLSLIVAGLFNTPVNCQENLSGTSLVVQWLRVRLPMQGTRVRSLFQEDPTCLGATKPASHNYWARVPQLLKPVRLEPTLRNKEKPPQWETRTPQWGVAPTRRNYRKPACSNKDPMQSKVNKINKFKATHR